MKTLKGIEYKIDVERSRVLFTGSAERLLAFANQFHQELDPREHVRHPDYIQMMHRRDFDIIKQYQEGTLDEHTAFSELQTAVIHMRGQRLCFFMDIFDFLRYDDIICSHHYNDREDRDETQRTNFRNVRRTFGKIMRNLPESQTSS